MASPPPPHSSASTTPVRSKDCSDKTDNDRGVAMSFLQMQPIRWKLFSETVEFQKGERERKKKCSMQPLAGKIEQDLFRLHTLMNANKCQSTPLWAPIMSMSENKSWKTRRQRTFFFFFLGQNIHVLPTSAISRAQEGIRVRFRTVL